MPKVTFLPDDVVIEVQEGTTLFAAAIEADVELESQCGGRGGCALCKVKLVQGDVTPMEWEEQTHLGTVYHVTQERLACQTQVLGEVVAEIPVPVERVKRAYVPHKFRRNAQQALLARLAAQESEVDSQRTVRGRARRRRRGPAMAAGDSQETAAVDERRKGPSDRGEAKSERTRPGQGAARGGRDARPRDGERQQAEASQQPAGGKRRRRRRKPRRRKGGGQGGAPGGGPPGGGGQGGPQPT